MRCRIIFLFLIASLVSQAQDNPTLLAQPIVQEGMRLYRSEMTSWYGTDLFLAKYSNRENLGGYFSYNDNEIFKCVFVSKAAQPLVIGTISFDSSFSTEIAKVDLTGRPLTTIENEYLKLRKKAIEIVNDDTIFNYYNNTSFNLIPLIDKDERKVYILTGPQKPGVVIFGNDYLLTFDNANNLVSKKPLHQNIIPVNIDNTITDTTQVAIGTSHFHLPETGDFITATDICTLMLYGTTANWQQHIVVSEKYLNIWNCLENYLTVIPRKEETK